MAGFLFRICSDLQQGPEGLGRMAHIPAPCGLSVSLSEAISTPWLLAAGCRGWTGRWRVDVRSASQLSSTSKLSNTLWQDLGVTAILDLDWPQKKASKNEKRYKKGRKTAEESTKKTKKKKTHQDVNEKWAIPPTHRTCRCADHTMVTRTRCLKAITQNIMQFTRPLSLFEHAG